MKHQLEFKNVTKYFPGVKALDNISFKVQSGEVIAFLGENGAGKSTLLKVLNGDYQPTGGQYLIDGVEKLYSNPKEAIDDGVSIIYQERQIIMEITVAENIFLGNLPIKKSGLIDTKKLYSDAQKIIDEFGLSIDPKDKAKDISVANQQMVEIMKAYSRKLNVIAFDEPTASLCDHEIESLFNIIRKLREEDKIIIYVSHRMNELDEIADKVAIFKDGKFEKLVNKKETTDEELIQLMVGRNLGDIFNELHRNQNIGEPLLEVKNLTTDYVKDITFTLRKGEILGFSGLVGAGRTEIMKAIIGIDKIRSGQVILEGKPIVNRAPKEAQEKGLVLVPEDRKLEGILPNMTVGENISISMLDKLSDKFGFINKDNEKEIIDKNIDLFNIKTPNSNKKIVELSGGNQQKSIVARWLTTAPKVLILDEPTKGIDIGAKSEFYKLICETARKGVGVIVISSELPEVIGLSDNIITVKNGRITGKISRDEATEQKVLAYAMIGEAE